jgi:RNA polymerase sigma-70 factor (ECF subfamily)
MIGVLTLRRDVAAAVEEKTGGPAGAWDEEGFTAFYDRTALRLMAYLRRASGDPALAEDVLQDAYLRFLRAPASETRTAEPAAYLFRIATNLLYDHWRRSGRERRLLAWWRPLRAPHDASLEHDVGRLLDELAPRERALLWLAHVEGWSHEEIGGILTLRPASVRVLLFRARARLARLLEKAGVGTEALR